MNKKVQYIIAAACIIQLIGSIDILSSGLNQLWGIINPVVLALVLSLTLNPQINKLSKYTVKKGYKRWNDSISVAIVYISFVLILLILALLVIPSFVVSATDFISRLPELLKTAQDNLDMIFKQYNIAIDIEAELQSLNISATISSMISFIAPSLVDASIKTANVVINIGCTFVIAVYLSLERKKVMSVVHRIFEKKKSDKSLLSMCIYDNEVQTIFSGFVVGRCIDGLIIGSIMFIATSLCGVPYALLISIIVGVTNIIPIFGPAIGGVLSFLIILIINPASAITFAVIDIILQWIDGNIIGPKIVGDAIGMPGLLVIICIVVFGNAFGIIGILLGIPLTAVLYVYLKRYYF